MSLDALTKKAQTKAPETSSGDRIEIIEVADTDPNHALVVSHFQGNTLKKESASLLGKASRLKQHVLELVLSNRASDRAKQFKFTADVGGGTEHTTTINVREQGYSAFDDSTLEKIKKIAGTSWADANTTRRIVCKVDFSLVPADRQDEIAAILLGVNTLLGLDVVAVDVECRLSSSGHEARTQLSEEDDRKLQKVLPTSIAFGK